MYFSYYSIHKSAHVAVATKYIGIAEKIGDGLNKEAYEQFLEAPAYNEYRQRVTDYLDEYRSMTNSLYVYILALDDTDVAKLMISAFPDGDQPEIGFPCTVPPKQVNEAKQGLAYYTGLINDGVNGVYLSVGSPLYNDTGDLIGVIAIDIAADDLEEVGNQIIQNNMLFILIDILFTLLLLLVFFMLHKWYKRQVSLDLKDTEKLYIVELSKVMETVKSSRHDMLNHFQVISGLIEIGRHEKARDYLKELSVGAQMLDLSLKVKNPVLMVLFQTKWEAIQSKNIQMIVDMDWNEFPRVESLDLVRIFSNLLDNALEAVEVVPEEHAREIRVSCKAVKNRYEFTVENSAELTAEEEQQLFQSGFTTKTNRSGARGNGLTIVKTTVKKYKGTIFYEYKQGKVLIKITI